MACFLGLPGVYTLRLAVRTMRIILSITVCLSDFSSLHCAQPAFACHLQHGKSEICVYTCHRNCSATLQLPQLLHNILNGSHLPPEALMHCVSMLATLDDLHPAAVI